MIEFNCPRCSKLLKTNDDKAGVRAKCPGCGESVLVPAASGAGFYDEFASEPALSDLPPRMSSRGVSGGSRDSEAATRACPMCGEQIRAAATRCRFCGEELALAGAGSAARRGQIVYAGFWLRFVAFIVDNIILFIPTFAVAFVIGAAVGVVMGQNQSAQVVAQLLGQGAAVVITWIYFAMLESSGYQATPGKMALGLIVTDDAGSRISFGRATGRHFAKIISGLMCLIGYIVAGFTERKQAVHDLLASTLVIRK